MKQLDACVETRCQKALEKAKNVQEELNAVVTFYELNEQLQQVKEKDHTLPLYGVPVALKDNISTKGMRTTASSRILDNYVPIYDAHVCEKLKDAGAVFIAKTSMDELGMGGTNRNAHTGPVNNPYDTNRISGGSSGGSAVLVAAGVVPFAIGTDTGDSVRKPAAYNGVIGMKPTYGRISRYGVIPYASSLDHVGYFATSVKDAARMLTVLAGRDDRDMTSSYKEVEDYEGNLNADIKGKRIAYLENVQNAVDPKIQENFNQLKAKLIEKGAVVEPVSLPQKLMEAILPTYLFIANAEATANHSNLDGIRFGCREDAENMEQIMIQTRTKGFSSYVRKRFVIGSYSLYTENQDKIFRKAQKVRRLIVDAYKAILDEYDAVMVSAAPTIAPLKEECDNVSLDHEKAVAENHMIINNFSGYPSMSVPSGFVDGMPVGINLSAKPFAEQMIFDIAAAVEEITGLEGSDKEVAV